MLRSHKNPPASRPIISLVNGPNLRAGFGGVHPAILCKRRQLSPDIAGGTAITDLENRMLQCFVVELHVEWTVQALDSCPRRKHDRQQLLKAAALPRAIECSR